MLNIPLAMVKNLIVILYILIAILHIHVGSQISFLQFWIWIWINFENKFPWKLNGGPENFPGNFLHNSNTINLPGGKAFWVFHLNSDTFLHGIISTLNPFHFRYSTALKLASGSYTFCSQRCSPTTHLAIIPKAFSLYKGWLDKDHRHH